MWPWLITIASLAVCLFLWFRDVRRIMRGKKSTLDSAAGQLISCRKKIAEDRFNPELSEILARSESIYQQGVDLYHQSLNKLYNRIPATIMGFHPIRREEYLLESDGLMRAQTPDKIESGRGTLSEENNRYFGSVRFFKNMILLAVVIMIAIPTCLTIRYSRGLRWTEQSLHETEDRLSGLLQEVEYLTIHEKDLQKELDDARTEKALEITELEDVLQNLEKAQEEERQQIQAEPPYAGLYPEFYAPQELSANVRETGVIYLTFDDGPSARTAEILDILKEKNVKATFFVVGSKDEYSKSLLKRIVEEGHTLGMHSYSHNYSKIYASVEDYLADMYQIFHQIKEATGVTPTLFRFPGGSINGYNSAIYQELVAEMMRRGFVPFDWNISNADASEKPVPVETLISNVISGAKKVERGVVLMHDSSPRVTTVQSLDTIIDRLFELGFELKALTPDAMPLLYAYRN